MQTLCACMQIGNEPVQSRMAPMRGPKKSTKIPFPTICHPNAAGSFSKDEYSLTVRVKLLSAMPRKKPATQSHIIIDENSVCSAKTAKKRHNLIRKIEFSLAGEKNLTRSCEGDKENR